MLLLPQYEDADHTVRPDSWPSLELPAHIAAMGNRTMHAGAQLSFSFSSGTRHSPIDYSLSESSCLN